MSDNQNNASETIIACNPNAIALDRRDDHEAAAKEIFSPASVLGIKELSNGYGFRLAMDSRLLHKVIDFIDNERLCCPFYTFTLVIDEQFWFELTGTPEVKAYIGAELVTALKSGELPTFEALQDAYTAASGSANHQ